MVVEVNGRCLQSSVWQPAFSLALVALFPACTLQSEPGASPAPSSDLNPPKTAPATGSPGGPEAVVLEHLKQVRAGTEHSVEAVPWGFADLHCVISTEHTPHSRQSRWLVEEGTAAILTGATTESLFKRYRFSTDAQKHPAADWVSLLFCATGTGLDVVDSAAVERWAVEGMTVPRLEATGDEHVLSFWSRQDNHRMRPGFRQHRVSVSWSGSISESVSPEVIPER